MTTSTIKVDLSTTVDQYAPSYAAVTTPFVQPSVCAEMKDFAIVTFISSEWDNKLTTVILSSYNSLNTAFTSCQPSDWKDEYSVELSPGVCPQDWQTISMKAVPTAAGPNGFSSEAFCCPNGYTYAEFTARNHLYHCVSTFSADTKVTYTVPFTGGEIEVKTMTAGLFIAPIWQIRWQESDVPSLSPRPPPLSHGTNFYDTIYTKPSATIKSQAYTYTPTVTPSSTTVPVYSASNVHSFVTIGLPIIFLSVLFSCSACWWFLKRKQRRIAVVLEAERLRMDILQSSEVRAEPDVHGQAEVLPAYTAHPPPSYKEN